MTKIFIIILRYLKTSEVIDHLRPLHLEFLDKYYETGHFHASGMQTPRNGGVIICKAYSREEVWSIVKEDNFYQNGAAEYQVFEFTPNKYSDSFKNLL